MSDFVFCCGHSRDSIGYYYVTASWVPYHIHTTCCDHSPCAGLGLGFSTPHNMIQLGKHHCDRQKETEKKRYPGCLAHAVIGMGVVANQRQPQYTYNVLQRGCQPRPTTIYVHCEGGEGLLAEGKTKYQVMSTVPLCARRHAMRFKEHDDEKIDEINISANKYSRLTDKFKRVRQTRTAVHIKPERTRSSTQGRRAYQTSTDEMIRPRRTKVSEQGKIIQPVP